AAAAQKRVLLQPLDRDELGVGRDGEVRLPLRLPTTVRGCLRLHRDLLAFGLRRRRRRSERVNRQRQNLVLQPEQIGVGPPVVGFLLGRRDPHRHAAAAPQERVDQRNRAPLDRGDGRGGRRRQRRGER